MLARLLRPTRGQGSLLGTPSSRPGPRQWRQIGYVSENQNTYDWMTLDRLIAFLSPFYPEWDFQFEGELREKLALEGKRKIKTLSRGGKVKIAMLLAMSFHPRLLILDEPFSGLDPIVKNELLDSLLEITRQQSWSVLLTSHDLEEVERLADRIVFLDRGRVGVDASLTELQERYRRVDVILDNPLPARFEESWVADVAQTEHGLSFIHTRYDVETARALAERFPPERTEVTSLSLKEIFVALAERNEG